jgi:2-methylcitrate dehydratase PrpD
MLSAAAATAGFDMPEDAFEEARRRVLRATGPASATPSGEWTILKGYLKPFAGVRHSHYGVEVALRLRRHPAFSLEKIEGIRLHTYAEAVQYCGNRAPRTAIQAQFSLSYAIAAALVLGDLGPNAYDDVGNPIIRRLEQSVVVEADPTRLWRGAKLTIDIGGTSLAESVDDIAGDPAMPMTKDQVVGKFRRYIEPILGEKDAGSLVRFFLEGDAAQPARKCFTYGV